MKQFRKWSLSNKLALVGIVIAAATLAVALFPQSQKIQHTRESQMTAGDNSPLVNTTGDVNINF